MKIKLMLFLVGKKLDMLLSRCEASYRIDILRRLPTEVDVDLSFFIFFLAFIFGKKIIYEII